MRPTQEHTAINRMLMSHGLGRLEDGPGLLAQLAYVVQDHEHFRSLLARCEPGERRNMYESMRPYLSFTAKPLDVYMAEAGTSAEARQLPVQAPDGTLQPFHAPVVQSDDYIAQQAVNKALARVRLVLTCRRCTQQGEFIGDRKVDAVYAARDAGWAVEVADGTGLVICPECLDAKAN